MNDQERLRQVQMVLGARGEAAVGTLVDGLQSLIVKARTGDKHARSALNQLRTALAEADLLLGVALPGES